MPALTEARNTPRFEGDHMNGGLAASANVHQGALVMRKADGYITQGATATGAVGVGVAVEAKDNSSGADDALKLTWRTGLFLMVNSAGADEITIAQIGATCFIVDDQTVAKTDGSSSRSPAGLVSDVTANGVVVRFDEALTNAA